MDYIENRVCVNKKFVVVQSLISLLLISDQFYSIRAADLDREALLPTSQSMSKITRPCTSLFFFSSKMSQIRAKSLTNIKGRAYKFLHCRGANPCIGEKRRIEAHIYKKSYSLGKVTILLQTLYVQMYGTGRPGEACAHL